MTVASEAAAAGGRRYALLLAMDDFPEYVGEARGGYFGVFAAAFGDAGERWDAFRVYDGEFPTPDEVAVYDGFVVTGSPSDAHGDEPWVLRLCDFLRTLHAMEKRLLGVCFGHQILCRALGGRVGKSSSGWDLGVRTVNLNVEEMHGVEFLKNLQELPRSAPLIEIHQDEVLELPPGATVLAYSEKTGVEMFAVGDHVLGVQGHPEMDMDIMHHIIDAFVDCNTITSCAADAARKAADEGREPDMELWTGLCKLFLMGKRMEKTAGVTLG
ncbi:hypothetical protein EJB05_58057 [Eragrostis curvula]|uniref:Glutamine amidotransferase domain-containing protein n=1 Tax=Eragrostis curvula TaxID=38414 RepID=A0A5J9SDA0_9POAL|nr:hypothetical protein EJB05_58057 [Eragrostis curvula]